MSELIEQLLNNLNIVSLVGFDGHGSNPIHGSSTGSNLHVDGNKNTWYCHSVTCKLGGGPLQWIASQLQGSCTNDIRDWQRVLKEACRITGIEYTTNKTPEQKNLQTVYNYITDYYHHQLLQHKELLQYTQDKWGYTLDQIKQLKIGYAPPSYTFLDTFDKKLLLKTGIFYSNLTPHFRSRIIMPYIIDGEPRYFIARRIDADIPQQTRDEMGKYIKLLQYSKKKQRTFISQDVKEPILRTSTIYQSNYVVITEGIADYYSLQLNNIPAITPVTISFKSDDYYRLKKYISNKQVYICNDAEDNQAGLEGALRIMEFIPHARIVLLPRTHGTSKIDVNDYFKHHNKLDFLKLIKESINGYHYLATKELSYLPIDEIELKQIKQLAVSYIVTTVNETNPMYIIKARKDTDSNKILYYNDGTYKIDLNDQWITKKIIQYLNRQRLNPIELTPNSVTNIINKIKFELLATRELQVSEELNRFNLETQTHLYINVLNGVIEIDKSDFSIQLLEHSHHYKFRSKLHVEYQPGFDPNTASLYLDTIHDILRDEQEVEYWLMEMAYLFTPSPFLQHIPHIVGIGNTGKSTILRPIEKMFDPEYVADTRLSLIIDNDYGTGNLYDIDLLSINEIDKDPTKGLEILKSLGTMETETLNPKYIPMIKNYQIKNKTVMRSNHYLKLKDGSEKRRVFVFRAHTKFDKSKVDPDREQKLLDIKDEIFNYIIQKYIQPLYEQRLELKSMTVERYDEHYRMYGDAVRTHLRICTEQALDTSRYTVEDMHVYFNKWAVDMGFDEISSIRHFGSKITKLAEEGTPPLFDVSQKIRMELEDDRGIKVRRTGYKGFDYTNTFANKYIRSNPTSTNNTTNNTTSNTTSNLNNFM